MPSVRELTRAAHQLAFSQTKMETSSERRNNHYDVIIVGLGPVGAVAANLMGSYGVRTLVLEKEQEIYKGPRFAPSERSLVLTHMLASVSMQSGGDRLGDDAYFWNGLLMSECERVGRVVSELVRLF